MRWKLTPDWSAEINSGGVGGPGDRGPDPSERRVGGNPLCSQLIKRELTEWVLITSAKATDGLLAGRRWTGDRKANLKPPGRPGGFRRLQLILLTLWFYFKSAYRQGQFCNSILMDFGTVSQLFPN